MKITEILNEEDRQSLKRPDTLADQWARAEADGKVPKRKTAEEQKKIDDALAEKGAAARKANEERKAKEKAALCAPGTHKWETTKSASGMTKYKCSKCTATKSIDSGD
jgi:hypothetical protein